MRTRVVLTDAARAQRAALAPVPKRLIRDTLREMEQGPYALDTMPLQPPEAELYRVRAGDYRIIFRPGPGFEEVTVTKIGHRASVYDGLEWDARP